MKRKLQQLFFTLTVVLGLLSLMMVFGVFFNQMPIDNLHYGTGELLFVLIVAPFLGFPAFVFGAINCYVVKNRSKKLIALFVITSFIGFSTCLLALVLFSSPSLYPKLNLNPHYQNEQQ